MPTSSFSQSRISAMKNGLADGRWTHRGVVCGCRLTDTTARLCWSGVKGEEGRAGTALVHPPTIPIPFAGRAWGKCLVCGCRRAGITARGCRSAVKGGGAGRYCPSAPSNHPHSPCLAPGQAWGTNVFCGCCQAGTTARANAQTQIVPNSSSLYTLFYSAIYNSVTVYNFFV